MSINLNLQNWPDASSSPPPPSSSAPLQMMNRSAAPAPTANNNINDLKLSKTYCTEEEDEQQQGSTMKSSLPPLFTTEEEHQMLSFSADSNRAPHLPHFYNHSASHYYNSPNFTGYNNNYCGGATNMNDLFNGPFTPSQWMELEQQALIYKHITSNMPIPSTLLMPIRRALNHATFSRYNSGHFSSMSWGGFHLGLQNNNDPEPGRCRRTDGKKWRCSRDAVTDQKYCERHINRGRHRSRKPVEGQSRYSVGKRILSSSAVLAGNIGSRTDGLNLGTSQSATSSRNSCDERVGVDSHNLLVPPPSLVMHPRESLYSIHNSKPAASYGQLLGSDFGLVSSDALKNPSSQTIIKHKSYEDKNVSSNRDSPSSPITLAWDFNTTPMVLQVGGTKHTYQQKESDEKHPNWIPDLRDSIIGGPLGEVLQNKAGTNNSKTKNTLAFASRTNSSAGSSHLAETSLAATVG